MRLWKLLQKMPTPVRYFFIRRIFTFSYQLPEGLSFKIAETTEEMEQAFHIIHDGFVERKLMDENETKLRINKYFALPTTTVIVCKHKDEVIATCSVIQDSKFGLPTDAYRDLDQFRKKDLKLVEVSGLAIAKNWRNRKGQLMIPLSKYMWEYVHFCLKADAIVISTAAYAKDFYRGLFLFEALDDDKVISFNNVKNSETVSQILFLQPFLNRLEKTYKNVPKERSLWELSKHVYPEFKYPERAFHVSSDPVLKPHQLEYFFKHKSNVLKELSAQEKRFLAETYFFQDYKKIIIENQEEIALSSNRGSLRAPVACRAHATDTNSDLSVKGEVREVSRGGLKMIIGKSDLKVGEKISVEVMVNDFKSIIVKAELKWKSAGEVGLQIIENNTIWNSFMDSVERRHPMLAGEDKELADIKWLNQA